MKRSIGWVRALVLVVLSAATWHFGTEARSRQNSAARSTPHGVDLAGMDRSISPGDDFFGFANGGWYRATDIPPDRSSVGVWSQLADEAEQRTRELLETVIAAHPEAGSDEQKIADYFSAYMDQAAIDARGLAPLAEFMKSVSAIGDRRGLAEWICADLRTDVDPLNNTNFHTDRLFGLWISQDLNHPERYAPYILQGGLGMPDRDYYLDDSPEMEQTRTAYRRHIVATLTLAGLPDPDATAGRIVALEKRIASAHWTRTQSSDVLKANNPWKTAEFGRRAPGIDWPACFQAAGLQRAPEFIVWQPSAIAGIAALVGSEPIPTWRDYLTFHLIDRYAGVLPAAFVDERFGFYGKVLSGTPQLRDRWKRAVDSTNAALGDAVGRLYVRRYFPAEAKGQLQTMVRNIVSAFGRRIDNLAWMDARTRAQAKAKLDTLIVGIGYPDSWRDYRSLEIGRGEALMNAWRADLFNYRADREKLGRSVDRTEWWITPQTVNALNLPAQNALNFPAAILRPPFYDPDAAPAVLYGSIGAVIGHEISHSFDDQGSQFDAKGRLASWWTPGDFAHFKAASARLVAQYSAYTPLPGLHVNGQLTLSENIADLAGLAAAYDAYRASRGSGTSSTANGGPDDQTFFLSFGQVWRTKMREALLRQALVTDGHAPDEYRADTVRNIDAWYPAFAVTPGQRLFLAPADRVRVW